MKVYFAADHAGFEMKNVLLAYVRDELGFEVEDCGAYEYDEHDDYPDLVKSTAKKVASENDSRAVIFGGSGQGEAIVANRFKGVRAVVYYGEGQRTQSDNKGSVIDIIESTRKHNDANILSIGARFVEVDEVKQAVSRWLKLEFSREERHQRRLIKIDDV